MNYLSFYTSLYSKLRNYGLPFWFLSPIRRFVRNIANHQLKKYLSVSKIKEYPRDKIQDNLIVSFTSFPSRIDFVWMVVETMKRQTMLPKKIILWLSKEQFPNETLPDSLVKEIDSLFEIRFVCGDIRSHKKYFYVVKEYPESYVFIVDDDILYSPDILAKTWAAHLKCPNHIICNYGFIMKYDGNKNLLPYNKWEETYSKSENPSIFFGSGGGTLIKPNSLYKDLTNIELAQELTPTADDVWLNAMARLAKVPCLMIKHGLFLPTNITDNQRLCTINVGENRNDRQIQSVINYYKTQNLNPFSLSC